ncbi:hypothetical protein [Nesterenkonia alkaliphila]|uniref:Serine/arginine repetitive matrix protein 2 n=1 Tax=Nesterenkonia alkaliphila TaxID=1463631 RepID=A0A7K1UF54_9MICC|nr:hypothetical protein [Nesterenkonia alkaliphila]MVT25079.1 hypothetical protein [Nesterenkonia alkaliphila]GFZ83161.1 hypothetical protein GCM10011359_09820 [Nesterenkonia alkaliphila]
MNTTDLTLNRQPGEGIDFTTGEGLRQVITELDAAGAWATSPVAAELMIYATRKYTPIAKAWHRSAEDAAAEAFFAMRTRSTVRAADPWAVVTDAVAKSIRAETEAERGIISSDAARRPELRPPDHPVRAGDYTEFLFDIHPRSDDVDGSDGGVDRVVRTAAVFLVATGWQARPIKQAVDYLVHRVCGLSSREAASETASGDIHIATRLGFRPDAWRGLVRLTVGRTPRRGEPERGLFARVLLGDQLADLLSDIDLVDASKRLTGQGLP